MCKGRWPGERRVGGIVAEKVSYSPQITAKSYHLPHNPPVRNQRFLTAPFTQGGLCGFAANTLNNNLPPHSKTPKLGSIETHVADSRTCCLHPASATHRQMTDQQLEAAGVGADLIRLSCGLENAEDLIADLAQAIDKV